MGSRPGAAWANARIAVPTVFLSTTLTFVITLVHLDRFHLGAEFGAATRAVTWGWLVVYSTVPVIMLVVAWGQRKAGGTDPERVAPRPRAVRALVGAQAVLLGASGIGLLVAPTAVAPAWPWELTPLTGRAIGAWLIGLGVAAAHALWEDSPRRIRAAAWGFVAFALLQGWALGRYPGDVDWGRAPAVVYVAFLVSTLVTGLAALRLDRPAPVG